MTTAQFALHIALHDEDTAAEVEDWAWGHPDTLGVTYHYDGETRFLGLEILAASDQLKSAYDQTYSDLAVSTLKPIKDADWSTKWQVFWHVNPILPGLVICPSWETYTAKPDEVVLHLDPGSAFGTGTHPTTQLVLLAMADWIAMQSPKNLLDVGTGSGILAIVAQKWGVSEVVGVDNDPLTVPVATENAERNGVELSASVDPLETFEGDCFDGVCANILASVIQVLLPELFRVIKPGGFLFLSGITVDQEAMMMAACKQMGLHITRVLQRGEWIAIVCQKP